MEKVPAPLGMLEQSCQRVESILMDNEDLDQPIERWD